MSWQVYLNESAVTARKKIWEDQTLPMSIKDYLEAGIVSLQVRHKEDVIVRVFALGHLHNGRSIDYPITSASININVGDRS